MEPRLDTGGVCPISEEAPSGEDLEYDPGDNGVRRVLKPLDDPFSDRSDWWLVEEGLWPAETADSVPRFMAEAVAGEGGLPLLEVLSAAGYGASPAGRQGLRRGCPEQP